MNNLFDLLLLFSIVLLPTMSYFSRFGALYSVLLFFVSVFSLVLKLIIGGNAALLFLIASFLSIILLPLIRSVFLKEKGYLKLMVMGFDEISGAVILTDTKKLYRAYFEGCNISEGSIVRIDKESLQDIT